MRKITLLLMSMFFVLGTAMADDKKDETQPVEFKLLGVQPADGASETRDIYSVALYFTKDIEVTLPEGGIEVKNEAEEVVLKLTRLSDNEYLAKSTAMFLFEQKVEYDEKEGKEQLVDQYIDAPGTYSYTIPAGCIKSVDGEEFPEQTFTFSIPNVFDYVSVLPETTTEVAKLETITLTFDKEITAVDTDPYKMYVQDENYTTFIDIESATISEDKKTVTLKLLNPATVSGNYYFICYSGVFTSADNAINSQYTIEFTVVDPTPSFETNYKEGEKVKEVGNLEITFKNVTEVKLVDGKSINIETEGSTYAGTATLENNKITVVFDQQFTEEGNYTFVIPEGMFTMDGVENAELELTVELFTFNITDLEIVSVTPGDKNVEKLERIVIEFNQNVRLSEENWQQISREIKLKSGEKEYTLTYNPSSNVSNKLEYIANAEWTGFEYAGTPITEEGTYELDLAALVVDYASESYTDEYGYPATRWHVEKVTCEGKYTWTIVPTSVENIEIEEGEQVIYDLTGRRVEEITNAGIYIVNGKKVLVK